MAIPTSRTNQKAEIIIHDEKCKGCGATPGGQNTGWRPNNTLSLHSRCYTAGQMDEIATVFKVQFE